LTDTINDSNINSNKELKNNKNNSKIKKMDKNKLIDEKIIIKKSKIKDKIKDIQIQIIQINNYTEELDYYNDTIDILLKYYNNTNDDKSILFDNYMKIVNNISIKNDKKIAITICNICGIEKNIKQVDKTLICLNCGDVNNIAFDSDKCNIKENNEALYKRSNHLCELLNQF
jgi:transcription elongation factor Elf1